MHWYCYTQQVSDLNAILLGADPSHVPSRDFCLLQAQGLELAEHQHGNHRLCLCAASRGCHEDVLAQS